MHLKLIILLISLSFSLSSQAKSKFWVKFGDKKINLQVINSGFINQNCDKKCLALSLVGKAVEISSSADDAVNKNPFSIACKKLGGNVRIGKLYSGNSQSFCFMKDKSILSTNLFDLIYTK